MLAGGKVREDGVLMPTVLGNVTPDMKVCAQEVFGPVVALATYRDLDEALALANDTRYGLQAAIFTAELDDALRAARTLDFGGVLVNEVPTFRADQQPYGGVRDSGNTREGPQYAVREMTEERLVIIQTLSPSRPAADRSPGVPTPQPITMTRRDLDDASRRPEGPLTPEVVEELTARRRRHEAEGEQVARPTKLIRIASMVRSLLDEARRAPLDDAGRRALKEIHERSIHELEEILSADLRQELDEVTLPFSSETPSESELRIAQAQLVGWLEGLFHGIQATMFTQQMQAQRQFEEMRGGRARSNSASPDGRQPPGAYL